MIFFLFSRDFVLAISGLFLDLYIRRREFFLLVVVVENVVAGRVID